MPTPLADALADVRASLLARDDLVRAVAAGRRRAAAPPWRRVELRPVQLKAGRLLQVVRYDDRQATTTNHAYDDALPAVVDDLLALPFGNWHVETAAETMQLRVTKKAEAQVHRAGGSGREPVGPHDRTKTRLLDSGDPLFAVLGADADKRRQVDAFLRTLDPVLAPVLAALGERRPVRVVDLGCGNAYLTFAAYRFLTAVRGVPAELVGVDIKAAARERNEKIAAALGWADDVRFVEGSIAAATVPGGADLVLALHACDTATDEALSRAVRWRAPVVLAAPCCHHEVQRQLRPASAPEPYGLLTRDGILRERFGDVLTDALRAAVLRLSGYRVDVVEFVASRHTPRNTLLRAVRTDAQPTAELVSRYDALVGAWDVRPPLAELLAPEMSAARRAAG